MRGSVFSFIRKSVIFIVDVEFIKSIIRGVIFGKFKHNSFRKIQIPLQLI